MRPKLTKVLAGALCRQMRHYIFINSSNGSKHCSRQAGSAAGRLVCTAERKVGKVGGGCDSLRAAVAAATSLSPLPVAARRAAAQIAALTTPLGSGVALTDRLQK